MRDHRTGHWRPKSMDALQSKLNQVLGKEKTKGKKKLSRAERLKKQKEKEIKALIWEVSFYVVFLVLLLSTAFNNRDTRAYRYRVSIMSFVDQKSAVSKISTPTDMWKWANKTLIPFIYGTVDWKGRPLNSSSNLVSNLASYRLGPTRLRQHRAKNNSCIAHDKFAHLNVLCVPSWHSSSRDWKDYNPRWTDGIENSALVSRKNGSRNAIKAHETDGSGTTKLRSSWNYTVWSEIGGLPVTGDLGVYPPGGYVLDIVGDKMDAHKSLNYLESNHWVDEWTKVVLFEITLYCPNVNMFAMITAIFEFPQAEVIMAKVYIHPFRLFTYMGNYPIVQMVCDWLVYAAIMWFAMREAVEIYRQRTKYFKQFWNILELINLLTSLAAVSLYVGRQIVTDGVSKEAKKAEGHFYNFQTLAMWDELFGILVAFVCFLSTLQMLHLLRFNRRMSILGATMKKSASDLSGFSLVFILVFLAFVSFSYIIFGAYLYSYSSIIYTIEALLLAALGDVDYEKLTTTSRVFAPAFIFLFMMFVVFLLINMLITILMDSFAVVRDDVQKQPNDHELIDYMVDRATALLWNYNPFRACWGFGRKIGLLSKLEPDSQTASHVSRPQQHHSKTGTAKLAKPVQRRRGGPRHRYRSRFNANISALEARLNMLQNVVDDLFKNECNSHEKKTVEKIDQARKKRNVSFEQDEVIYNLDGDLPKSSKQPNENGFQVTSPKMFIANKHFDHEMSANKDTFQRALSIVPEMTETLPYIVDDSEDSDDEGEKGRKSSTIEMLTADSFQDFHDDDDDSNNSSLDHVVPNTSKKYKQWYHPGVISPVGVVPPSGSTGMDNFDVNTPVDLDTQLSADELLKTYDESNSEPDHEQFFGSDFIIDIDSPRKNIDLHVYNIGLNNSYLLDENETGDDTCINQTSL